jgi:hypothetical protein
MGIITPRIQTKTKGQSRLSVINQSSPSHTDTLTFVSQAVLASRSCFLTAASSSSTEKSRKKVKIESARFLIPQEKKQRRLNPSGEKKSKPEKSREKKAPNAE